MQVYKFGGASVKSADAIRNLSTVLKEQKSDLLIVISAMSKTTNALEKLLMKFFFNKNFEDEFNYILKFHSKVAINLFKNKHFFHSVLKKHFNELLDFLKNGNKENFDKTYDAIVSRGEILSTLIISFFLNEQGIENKWLDARKFIITDDNYRAASVDFELTKKRLFDEVDFKKHKIYITQGFIGSTKEGIPTTLGREGSDYSAAVIANLFNAENLTLWKDVAGIYNIDPKMTKDKIKIKKMSYREATELAYFGAKVIHPKTTKPLMCKNISLKIRSFNNVLEQGTIVANFKEKIEPKVPVFIFIRNQILATITTNEFIDEFIFEKIYSIFKNRKTKINLLQNSALNLSVCFDYNSNNFKELISDLTKDFSLKYNSGLTLITIRHYTKEAIRKVLKNKKIILEQKNRLNAFYLIEE